jgi:tRNA(adenine34) deaminase
MDFDRLGSESKSILKALKFIFIRITERSYNPALVIFEVNGMELELAEKWMREALIEARKAEAEGEIPVGAVLLINEKIVARTHNTPIKLHDPTAHAEIAALRQAGKTIQNYRLPGALLVVTIEPCLMCVGAMIHARIEEVIYGAPDPKGGAITSCFQLADNRQLNHKIKVTSGVLESECSAILRDFFSSRRKVNG